MSGAHNPFPSTELDSFPSSLMETAISLSNHDIIDPVSMQMELTRESYKNKFVSLISSEEATHIELLGEKYVDMFLSLLCNSIRKHH